MTDKERIDYLMIMVARLIQLNVHERRVMGNFQPNQIFNGLHELEKSIMEQECVKTTNMELRI